jgi:hypothetical protein
MSYDMSVYYFGTSSDFTVVTECLLWSIAWFPHHEWLRTVYNGIFESNSPHIQAEQSQYYNKLWSDMFI